MATPSVSGCWKKTELCELRMSKENRRSLLLLCSTMIYLIFGAWMFSHLEYEQDQLLRRQIAEGRGRMWSKYNFSEDDFSQLEQTILLSIPMAAGCQWTFLGSLYFTAVTITTVGYGHSTPATRWGKGFCMAFALVGIPLGLVMFQSVGERINHTIRVGLESLWRRWGSGRQEGAVKSRHLLAVSISIGTMTIVVGTVVFHLVEEKWTVFDAYYFCVISLSTIGFGDFVPAQTHSRMETNIAYVLFSLSFLLFGLAVFSACVNLLILEFMTHNADASARLKRMLSMRARRPVCDEKWGKYRMGKGQVKSREIRRRKERYFVNFKKKEKKKICYTVRRMPLTNVEHLVSPYYTIL